MSPSVNACCSTLAVLLAFSVRAAVGPWDADVSDFPRAAGETGDAVRIFNCGYYNNWVFKMDNPVVFAHEGGSLIVTGGRFSKNPPNAVLYRRGEKAGRLIWRDNQPLNFTEAEMKDLNDELRKQGESDKSTSNNAKLAG